MRLDEYYTISEFLQLNEESAKNEFKPKFGNGAKRGSNENDKAVKEILKNAQAFDEKGRTEKARRKPEVEFEDYNKTTMDVNFEYEPSKEWKDRVKKLATVGTESDMADCYDTEGNENFYKKRKEMSKDRSDRNEKERQKGIVGRNNTDHKAKDYSDKTGFINESYLIGPIIDGYKAQEISDEDGYNTPEEGAAAWFKGVIDNASEFEEGEMPEYHQFIDHIDEIDADMYYDYGADYYFVAKENTGNLNESGFTISPMNNGANHVEQFTHDDANPGTEGDITMDGGINGTHDQRKTVSESKPMKRLKFKNTIFLSESQVLARVPEDYKVDENRFYMQDKTGTDYLVECKADPFGHIHLSIENRINKQHINEELAKMKKLAGYAFKDDNVKVDRTKLEDMSESISNFRELLK